MTTHEESPIIRTSRKRMAQGLVIVVITMAVGAGIAVPFWNQMAQTPPPASTIVVESPTVSEGEDEVEEGAEEAQQGGGGAATTESGESATTKTTAAGTTITILAGSSVQGSPDYEPEDAKVPLNDNIVWVNKDTVPHTATSGTGAEDPNSAKVFDTSIINGGEESAPQQLTGVKEGDEVPYYCQVHPYMTSKLIVTAASTAGGASGTAGSAGAGGANVSIANTTTRSNATPTNSGGGDGNSSAP
jgi:plastocyanin